MEGRTLRCELDLEDEGRQMVVFQRAQSSFSRCLTDLRVDMNVLKKTVKKPMEESSRSDEHDCLHAVMSAQLIPVSCLSLALRPLLACPSMIRTLESRTKTCPPARPRALTILPHRYEQANRLGYTSNSRSSSMLVNPAASLLLLSWCVTCAQLQVLCSRCAESSHLFLNSLC